MERTEKPDNREKIINYIVSIMCRRIQEKNDIVRLSIGDGYAELSIEPCAADDQDMNEKENGNG